MATDLPGIMRRVRRRLNDFPDSVLITNALAADTTDNVLTLDTGQGDKLPTAGVYLETDDFTAFAGVAEPMLVVSTTGDAVTVRRAYQESANLRTHDANTFALIAPTYRLNRINDAISEIIDGHLWPHVWTFAHTQLTPNVNTDYYSPAVSDIKEIVYLYQLYVGFKYVVHGSYLPPDVVDSSTFPNGAISVNPYSLTDPSSPVYCAYKRTPALSGTTPAVIDDLISLGASALLVESKEIEHASPSRSSIEAKVGDAEKLRAGAAAWNRFMERRGALNASLMQEIAQAQKGMRFSRGL